MPDHTTPCANSQLYFGASPELGSHDPEGGSDSEVPMHGVVASRLVVIAEFLADSGVVLGGSALESIKSVWGLVRRNAFMREKWGLDTLKHTPAGLCLLFHGPSETGKTLTARCLCRALGRELP